jgi:NADPH:quinone reductase-like Zn-dependent oxidoreductase
MPELMRAIVQQGYGAPAVLALREIEAPGSPGPQEVLVEVHAGAVNALDWHLTRGMPRFLRLIEGIRTPRNRVRGVDLAGRVRAVGSNVTRFKPGDLVWGGADGSLAELALTREERLVHKPASLGFGEAAALYVAGLTALQGLRDKAKVQAGQRVLVLGAGGGVGIYAVQLAKWLGAQVTAVTRTDSVALARSLGADQVIDYTKEDFTRRAERWDAILYLGGSVPFTHCRRVVTPHGTIVVIGGPAGGWFEPMGKLLRAMLLSLFVSQRLAPFVSKNVTADLELLSELAASGAIRSVIDRSYPLAQAAEGIAYVGAGLAKGKIVISVAASDAASAFLS